MFTWVFRTIYSLLNLCANRNYKWIDGVCFNQLSTYFQRVNFVIVNISEIWWNISEQNVSIVMIIGDWKGFTDIWSNSTNICRRTSWIIMIDTVEDRWLEEIAFGWQIVDGFLLSYMNALPWCPVWYRDSFLKQIETPDKRWRRRVFLV